MKLQVSKCSTMHYMSDTAPIILCTDASDYGIGGYLFQTIDGIDQPVAFVSKSLSKSQLRWSVIQFNSYMYFQSLLRDRFFTIRTGRQKLLFIKEASNPMIVRWYMALSEFSFNLEFIRGVDNNNIADAMSRLCRNNMIDSPDEYSNSRILSEISRSFKPDGILYSKIGRLYNSTVGPFGVERMLKHFQAKNVIWKYQRQHIKWFIDHCPCCQK